MSNEWLTIATIGSVSFICYFLGSAIYELYFSPLAKYPGPLLAKISSWPNFYYATTGYRHIWIWKCHQIYGDTVRFKPDGLMFNTPDAYRAIHGTRSNVKKAKFYETWPRNPSDQNTLSAIDKAVHARKRRVLNSAFSEKAIRSAGDFVVRHVDRWNELLIEGNDGKEWTKPQNMSDLADYLVFDIMGDLSFGKSCEIKEPGKNPFRHIPHTIGGLMQYMYPISQSPILRFWVWLKPRGLDSFLERGFPKHVKEFYEFVEENVAQRKREEEILQKSGTSDDQTRKDLFHYLFNAKDDAGNPGYSGSELHAEANMLVVGGSDTTATTIAGFWFYITRHPKAYARLVEEIRTTFKSADDIKMGATLSSCKYLQACIDEALRLAPPGVGELPREVLPGGLELNGKVIPQGVQVGVTVWSINHNQESFGDPWVFRPERYIEDSKTGVSADDVAHAKGSFFPFSMGAGNCVGQKLATWELLITIGKTLHRMDVRLSPGDTLGAGSPELGWGSRDKGHVVFKDYYLSLRNGPMVEFRKRTAL